VAGRKKAPMWRQAFLRALKRTGNVRASAFEAGVDPGTAYDHRAKDPAFRAHWAEARAAFRAMKAKAKAAGEELVLRRTRHGDKLVRAGPGRWSARIEESFLDGLELTGCVRTAARAAGISAEALYKRRDRYPEFRARWDERLGRNKIQLPGLLDAAAVSSLSPVPEGAKRRGRARLPAVSVDQAIRIKVANDNAQAKGRGRGGIRPEKPEQSHEEAANEFVRLVGIMKRRRAAQRLAEGWTRVGDGIWLPPGWTAQGPEPRAGPRSGAPGNEEGDGREPPSPSSG